MRLTINVDAATSIAAGYEPVDYLDIDITTLSPDDRSAIASIMSGTRIMGVLPHPTVEGLLTVARERRDAKAAEVAREEAKAAEYARMWADLLAARPTIEAEIRERDYETGVNYTYVSIRPDCPAALRWGAQPAAYQTWERELAIEAVARDCES